MKKALRFICIALVAVMTVAVFAGCTDGSGNDTTAAQTNDVTTSGADDTTQTAPATDEGTKQDTESQTEEQTEEQTGEQTEENTEPAEGTDESGLTVQGETVLINNREDLFKFAELVNDEEADFSDMTIKLTADIDLDPSLEGGRNWTPIGTVGLEDATIDGDGHVINGMTITQDDLLGADVDSAVYGTGFIGISTCSLTVKNITFANAYITSSSKHCGCVIGSVEEIGSYVELDNVTVSNLVLNGGVGVEGDISGISIRVGNLIGANIVPNCTVVMNGCKAVNCKIFGFHNIGGLIGCVISGQLEIDNNTVENIQLNYSAGYADNENYKNPTVARYFADPFYCVTDYWGEYHTDVDKAHNNTLKNVDSYDIRNDIHYTDEEGKTGDYPDELYPVGAGTIRPKDERPEW